jgi:hypothetical protein
MQLPNNLQVQMEDALSLLEETLNDRYDELDIEAEQETNIFKILKLEKHEIRHGAFLDFLLDPERNVQLAEYFAACWLEQIAEELELDDSAINDIINGEDFSINKIQDEERYSEISIIEKGKLRIDHALELKVGNRKRVLVFEYKVNGIVQNDLKAYEEFVVTKYPGKQSEVLFFILDLGSKIHTGELESGFTYLNKSTLVEAVSNTLDEARRRDMQATRMYLEQYLEILDPDMCDGFLWHGMEKNLWDLWNPEICRYDNAGEVWDALVENIEVSESDQNSLDRFQVDELFNQAVIQELSEHGIETSRNQLWTRIKLPRNPYKYFFLNSWFCDHDEQLYIAIKLSSWQGRNDSEQTSVAQQKLVFDTVSEDVSFSGLTEQLEDLARAKDVWWSTEKKIVKKWGRLSNSKRNYDSSFTLLHPVSMEDFKAICIAEEKPPVFDMYIQNLLSLFNKCNRG